MEEDLVAYLLSQPVVSLAVGVNVYWIRAPQKVSKPYVVMYRVAGARDTTMDGASGLVGSRVQFDCWAEKTQTLFAVARAIETALSGARFDQGATEFRGCFLDAERDTYDDTQTPDKLFGKSLDFTIWHRRA